MAEIVPEEKMDFYSVHCILKIKYNIIFSIYSLNI